uniref:EF-hand calcium-binding domain-containing protein 5-like n=1 Tax=Saccoglossus kowalevskii TaxID=10224 RepID=A0ABM0MDK5_SACKO|nr:PREDICTED: EF-hand calcium-binding domain-containing protein 5-like [Saccoglossus kowalevskii]
MPSSNSNIDNRDSSIVKQFGPISSSLSGSAGRYRTPVSRPISNVRSPGSAKSPQQRTPLTDRPESVRSLASRSSMPDYLKPIVKTALKRWKRFHEQRVMDRLKERKEEKKLRVIQAREEKMKLARRIPIDVLAREWLKDNEATVEVRAYLLEKLLPVLIMGVEKLLVEVDKRGLSEEDEPAANFNPINYLAQYLMRNNPRLAKVKAEARRRREERERASRLKALENQRRSATLREQYKEWLVNQDGRVELHLVQEALKSFAEITESYPEEIKKASEFSHELESLDETGKTVSIKEFADYIKQFITDMPTEIFTEFLKHLSKCASAVRAAADSEARREILTNLFVSCDHSGVGLLDRHRVLNLFETFYDNATSFIKKSIRNPRKWPVVELDEVTDETDSVRSESPRDETILESDKEARTAAEKEKDEDTTAVEKPSTPTKEATEEPAEDAEKTDEVKTGDDDEKAEEEAELAKEDDTTEKVEEKNEEETGVKEEETAVVEGEGNDDVTPAAESPKPSADEEIKAEDEKVSEWDGGHSRGKSGHRC